MINPYNWGQTPIVLFWKNDTKGVCPQLYHFFANLIARMARGIVIR
jgi:hypothetical protein